MQTNSYKHFDDWPEILTSKDLAVIMDCSLSTACKLMGQPGFPLLVKQKQHRKVNKYAFRDWMRRAAGNHHEYQEGEKYED
ncbi:MAG: DNA-binding protein [Clostridiaceae bacterium]|nr:DNA-binding protein [Clostridiaceae bacterium]